MESLTRRRTSAFTYVAERSLGLRNDFQEALFMAEARDMQAATRNYIYDGGMRVWSMELDPVEERYLLVGTAQSTLALYDLKALDDKDDAAELLASKPSAATAIAHYDTSNRLPACSLINTHLVRRQDNASRRARANSSTAATPPRGISCVDWYPVDGGLVVTSGRRRRRQSVGRRRLLRGNRVLVSRYQGLWRQVLARRDDALADRGGHVEPRGAALRHLDGERDPQSTGAPRRGLGARVVSRERVSARDRQPQRRDPLLGHSPLGRHRVSLGVEPGRRCRRPRPKPRQQQLDQQFTDQRQATDASHDAAGGRDGIVVPRSLTSRQRAERQRQQEQQQHKRRRLEKGTAARSDPHQAASVSLARAHSSAVNALAFTPDGRFLLSSGHDDKLRLWHGTTGEHLFANYEGTVSSKVSRRVQLAVVQEGDAANGTLVFHPNGTDGELAAFAVHGADGKAVSRYTAHYRAISACCYRKTRRELFTGGVDGLIMKWKPRACPLFAQDDGDEDGSKRPGDNGNDGDGDQDAWSDDDVEDAGDGSGAEAFVPAILRS
ncbi:hypothetical protein PINS_up022187 [Pythium insidiosum]|nr:hypothetical protein PINS_up022187 [Pythium insidiosum]